MDVRVGMGSTVLLRLELYSLTLRRQNGETILYVSPVHCLSLVLHDLQTALQLALCSHEGKWGKALELYDLMLSHAGEGRMQNRRTVL